MFRIFAMFAFGMMGAAALSLDTVSLPSDPNGPVALVFANDHGAKDERPEAAARGTSGKQRHVRKASKDESGDGFCECSDERVRAHCLIYMKLRRDRT